MNQIEAGHEIGGCTVTWDADEAEVVRSLMLGDLIPLMQRLGFREFGELREKVIHKFNQAVTEQAERV